MPNVTMIPLNKYGVPCSDALDYPSKSPSSSVSADSPGVFYIKRRTDPIYQVEAKIIQESVWSETWDDDTFCGRHIWWHQGGMCYLDETRIAISGGVLTMYEIGGSRRISYYASEDEGKAPPRTNTLKIDVTSSGSTRMEIISESGITRNFVFSDLYEYWTYTANYFNVGYNGGAEMSLYLPDYGFTLSEFVKEIHFVVSGKWVPSSIPFGLPTGLASTIAIDYFEFS